MSRLNLGCGRNLRQGWINLDIHPYPGVDMVLDLNQPSPGGAREPFLPIPDDSVEEFLLSHILEHVHEPLRLMQELWRIAIPGAVMTVRCPYGSSDDAWELPTQVRGLFLQSFDPYAQPSLWRAEEGYRGDWKTELITLHVAHELYGRFQKESHIPTPGLMRAVMESRNVVREMIVTLAAVKPRREPRRELQAPAPIAIRDSPW
jgi:predicted SAM-dependent methyltransferase